MPGVPYAGGMHDTHPQDYAPLSFGAGLALGLLLILALPREPASAKPTLPLAPAWLE